MRCPVLHGSRVVEVVESSLYSVLGTHLLHNDMHLSVSTCLMTMWANHVISLDYHNGYHSWGRLSVSIYIAILCDTISRSKNLSLSHILGWFWQRIGTQKWLLSVTQVTVHCSVKHYVVFTGGDNILGLPRMYLHSQCVMSTTATCLTWVWRYPPTSNYLY